MSADVLGSVVLAVTEDEVSAGPFALLIVVLMGIATVLLIRNMSARIKRLPPEFPPPEDHDAGQEPRG